MTTFRNFAEYRKNKKLFFNFFEKIQEMRVTFLSFYQYIMKAKQQQ